MLSPVRMTSLLTLECIALDVQASTPEEVFEEIGRLVAARHSLKPHKVAERLMRRESRRSTGLGYGLALPHADTYSLSRPVTIFLRMKKAVPFAAPDGSPVSNVLALLVPRPATACHHELLARYTRLLARPDFRRLLDHCTDVSGIWRLFDEHAR